MIPLWMPLLLLVFGFGWAEYLEKPPPTIHVSRDWSIADTTPVGNVVNTVLAVADDNTDVVFGLEQANGLFAEQKPEPLPFTINEKTGQVSTNRSLINIAGRDIFMAVTARYVDSNLSAKMEIWVKIVKSTDKNGSTRLSLYPKNPGMPNLPSRSPSAATPPPKSIPGANIVYTADHSTIRLSDGEMVHPANDESEVRLTPTYADPPSETPTTTENSATAADSKSKHESGVTIYAFLKPSMVIVSSLVVSALIVYLFRKKLCKKRLKISKEDVKKSSSSVMSLEESMVLQHWRGIRDMSNRFSSWDSDSSHNNQLQRCSATALSNTKSVDKWEIPRHHIKVFSILGEGCFGQVWKCEALGIESGCWS